MNAITYVSKFIFIALFISLSVSVLAERTLPMPPRFSLDGDPAKILNSYPLGVINEQAAFSHHGGAHRKVQLPNGKEGWLYNVGKDEWHRTYTLVFGADGKVIDVIYYDHSKNAAHGLTAVQFQSRDLIVNSSRLGTGPN